MALVAFHARAVELSDYVIDEGSLLGDVNADGKVNVSDVTTLINMILGFETTNQARADVNGDGKVNVSDVTALINIILGTASGGTTGGSVIHMLDFVPNNLSSYSPDDYKHKWVEGDVIFISVDPDFQSTEACQNVYAMVRTGGKWVLKDVNGSSKLGFKNTGGKLCAAYVQHADLANSYYDYIPIKGDVACTPYSANYTVTVKDNKLYITIRDILLYHFVSRIDVSGAYEGDYFHESVTRLDALKRILAPSVNTYSAFETSNRAPVIDIDSNHKGHAYGVWKMGTRADGWLTLNYTKSNGYAYVWTYGQDELYTGNSLSLYSPWQNGWNRDLSMRYYNHDDNKTYRLNAGTPGAQDVNINVGTNIIFRPYDGDKTDSNGTMTSVTSSASGILDINSSNDQVSVVAHKVGTTTLTIKFKTKDGINTTYTYNVTVNPTVWVAGKTSDNKPMLWRNWQSKGMYLSGRDNYTSANEVIVRGSTAYVMMRKDVSNSNTSYYSGTAAILKATEAHGGGYFNIYKKDLTGRSKQYGYNGGYKYYLHAVPRMWADKNGNVYYTSATRENYTTELDGYINTDVYKNKTKLQTMTCMLVNDLATDNSGKLYLAGMTSDYQSWDGSYSSHSMGAATADLAIIDANNNVSVIPWTHYMFHQLLVKDNTLYVNANGYYKDNGWYPPGAYKNVFLRYTSATGLQLYTGSVSDGGFSMDGATTAYGTTVNQHSFCFDTDKFYYSGSQSSPIRTYQLGASQTASYTAYPSGTSPILFDVKNGMIGMVLNNGSSSPLQVMSSKLNTVGEAYELENSEGTTIYDVWLQTSLDD